MKSAEIRESFLRFFESKGCRRLPSSSLVPDDPSLLLTSAGMVQFKPVFLGVTSLGFTRATTCQKCARTTDIDIIGTTGRHQSFFEMLGNFSFGDYFKSEACAWAYEYSVDILGLDVDKLWFSIYEDDDEAERIWRDEVGVPQDRIVRMGAEDNFWSAGPTGPCGPCSELYYDQGAEVGCGKEDCAPGCDCDRFLEYWNLVFMQYDRHEDGTLVPLPKQNIDTGMGLERMASVLQGVGSNFETDSMKGLLETAAEITGARYGEDARTDTSLRILTDHSRAVAFLIADGVLPSNEGRGYVLRRLLRRAVRHGRLLGVNDPFLVRLVAVTIEEMGATYPELAEHQELILQITEAEETRFGATLRQGLTLLEAEIERTRQTHGHALDGGVAFSLHDTYGFPIELTAEIAGEEGLAVDMTAFEADMAAQRERGRAGVKDESWAASSSAAFSSVGEVEFLGYGSDTAEAKIAAIVSEGERVERLEAGQAGDVVLDQTPFYGEQGGQVGDTGTLSRRGTLFEVRDTKMPLPGVPAHRGVVVEGAIAVGDKVHAAIDVPRRERIRRNHTATHLLHWALRLVLGEHVKQAGSYVAPDRLRFDFTHFEAPSTEDLSRVERMVNAKIMEDHPVRAYETSLVSAREAGVTALFGEKYGDFVRVLEIGNFSKELCAGTHIARTSEIGFVKIVSEGSVGANLRRIEAVTSFEAMQAVYAEEAVLARAAEALKCRPMEAGEKAEALVKRAKDAEKALAGSKRRGAAAETPKGAVLQSRFGPVHIAGPLEAADPAELREISDAIRSPQPDAVVVLAAQSNGKAFLLAAGPTAAVERGFDAGALIRAMAPAVGGSGGGKAQMAQAGGSDPSGIGEALRIARESLGVE